MQVICRLNRVVMPREAGGFLVVVVMLLTACGSDSGAGEGADLDTGSAAGDTSDGGDATVDDSNSPADTQSDSIGQIDPIGGCGTPGWQALTMTWADFRYADPGPGGVTICHPSVWIPTGTATNVRSFRGTDDNGDAFFITLGAEHRLDHDDAIARMLDNDSGRCTNENYTGNFVVIDGWPALENRFDFEPPVCGECEPIPEPTIQTMVSTHVAAGEWMINISSQTETSVDATTLGVLVGVGRSLTTDGAGSPVADAQGEAEAAAASVASCTL